MLGLLNNIPQVTKNLLLINILLFVLTIIFQAKGIDLTSMLGAHYINSPLFEPYQVVSHFFMHADIMHIFFNMFALVMFGGFLERLWGPRRYFIFYIAAALGAFALYNVIGYMEIEALRSKIASMPGPTLGQVDSLLKQGQYYPNISPEMDKYVMKCLTPMVGASGAIFGIMAAFAILFPNTELSLMFIPVPVKAKFLIGGYFIYEVYRSVYQVQGDNVAHLAHVGGAVVGAALVLFWRKRDKTNFY